MNLFQLLAVCVVVCAWQRRAVSREVNPEPVLWAPAFVCQALVPLSAVGVLKTQF